MDLFLFAKMSVAQGVSVSWLMGLVSLWVRLVIFLPSWTPFSVKITITLKLSSEEKYQRD